MNVMEEALSSTVVAIWESLLGSHIYASPPQQDDDTDGSLVGCVHLTGREGGVVTLRCSAALAREAAAAMFHIPRAEVALEESEDALGELTNIVGGNFKALLSDGHHLSLPIVVEGADFRTRFLGTELAARVTFDCCGRPLVASFYRAPMAAVA